MFAFIKKNTLYIFNDTHWENLVTMGCNHGDTYLHGFTQIEAWLLLIYLFIYTVN